MVSKTDWMLSLFLSHKIEQPFNWKGRRERERNRLNRLNNPLLKDGSGEDAQLIWGEQKLRGITKEISGRRSNYPKESERKVALGNLRLAAHSANWTDRITPNSSSVSGFGRSDDDLTSAAPSLSKWLSFFTVSQASVSSHHMAPSICAGCK